MFPTLESVTVEFEQWRASRPSPSTPIPQPLWQQVAKLWPHYKPSKIYQQLRLSSTQVKKQSALLTRQRIEPTDFVELPIPSQAPEQDCALTITGDKRSLHLTLKVGQLSTLLPALSVLL